mgnify:CR=1 FL=1
MTVRQSIDPQGLLPHRPPMLMISEVVSWDHERAHFRVVIQADNPLLTDSLFPAVGGIELLAQASGILLAVREGGGGTGRPGAIAQIKSYEVGTGAVPVGDSLDIHANVRGGNEMAAMFDGQVIWQQELLFEGSLMITLLREAHA